MKGLGLAPNPASILDQDPRGRVDVLAVRTCEAIVKRGLPPEAGKAWDAGLGQLVEAVIVENLPSKAYTAADLGRALGILGPEKRNAKRSTRKGAK